MPSLNDLPLLKTHAFIGGTWRDGASGKKFSVVNPADGKRIAQVADCGAADAQNAIKAAADAFPAWRSLLAKERGTFLKKWAVLIRDNTDQLAQLLSNEQGKPLAEAKGEVTGGAAMVEWAAEEARRMYGETIPSFKAGSKIVTTHEPIGVCAAITPWNFPHSMITRKVAPALSAGCTVVLKPAEDTPLSALALAALAEEAGFPKGIFNVVPTNQAAEVGKVLCTSTDVRKLSFTGSTEVGRLLMAQCAPTLKRLSMELGGNAPFLVFADADLDLAVKAAISSKFRNSGQTCICANRLYIQRDVYDAFAEKFKAAIAGLKVGPAFDDGVSIGPLINEDGLKKVESLVHDAIGQGAKVAIGGATDQRGGLFYQPTLLLGANKSMRLAKEEIFGPVAALFPFDSEEEAIALANDTEHGLAAYFYTRDLGRAFRVSESLEYGMVGVNEPLLANEGIPFGGIKQSGFGREGGPRALEDYTVVKYILLGGL